MLGQCLFPDLPASAPVPCRRRFPGPGGLPLLLTKPAARLKSAELPRGRCVSFLAIGPVARTYLKEAQMEADLLRAGQELDPRLTIGGVCMPHHRPEYITNTAGHPRSALGLDLEISTGTGTTSVVAVKREEASQKYDAAAGDMDALPMPEDTARNCSSTVGDHACVRPRRPRGHAGPGPPTCCRNERTM